MHILSLNSFNSYVKLSNCIAVFRWVETSTWFLQNFINDNANNTIHIYFTQSEYSLHFPNILRSRENINVITYQYLYHYEFCVWQTGNLSASSCRLSESNETRRFVVGFITATLYRRNPEVLGECLPTEENERTHSSVSDSMGQTTAPQLHRIVGSERQINSVANG